MRAEGEWSPASRVGWGTTYYAHLIHQAAERDQLAGRVQEAYGVSKDEAEKQIRDWEDRNKDLRQ